MVKNGDPRGILEVNATEGRGRQDTVPDGSQDQDSQQTNSVQSMATHIHK